MDGSQLSHYHKSKMTQVWWSISVIPVLGSLRQEDGCRFKASQDHMVNSGPGLTYVSRFCFQKRKEEKQDQFYHIRGQQLGS